MDKMRIALIGFGLEAKSAYDFLRAKFPAAKFDIYDQNEKSKVALPENVNFFGGVRDFSQIQADLIVRTPAVAPSKLPKNAKITSVTNLFFENCPAKIIGVTGTKGKGTTSGLIASILRASGKKVHLVGNIGVPALDLLPEISPEDFVVYELSSFQLWDVKKSPEIAVVLMIEPDHLDVHADFAEYLAAKSNIRAFQKDGDFVVRYPKNENSKIVAGEKSIEPIFESRDGFLWRKTTDGEQKICSTSELKLPGEHNIENAKIAMTAAFLANPEISNEQFSQGLSGFTGLPHRLKFVREIRGVKFYDDSISTTPGSAIAALKSFSEPKILLLGGSNKGADLSPLFAEISASKSIRKVLVYGAESSKLAEKFTEINFKNFENLGEKPIFEEVVKRAFAVAESGDVVILSPAHASFDMFSSYADRGEQFVRVVENL